MLGKLSTPELCAKALDSFILKFSQYRERILQVTVSKQGEERELSTLVFTHFPI